MTDNAIKPRTDSHNDGIAYDDVVYEDANEDVDEDADDDEDEDEDADDDEDAGEDIDDFIADILSDVDGVGADPLIAALARVIASVGVDRVLTRPIVLPNERFFPDPFDGSMLSVGRLLRRFMRFAGVADDIEVIVTTDELVTETTTNAWMSRRTRLQGSPIALSGCTSHHPPRLVFAVDAARLGDADALVGAAAREVARAVTLLGGVVANGADDTDITVDLCAIALGFGVFVANDASRIRSTGRMEGGMWWSENSVSQSGALTPQTASTALGAIVAARGLALAPIVECLEINQGHWTSDAVKAFAGRPLAHALGLPHAADAKASIRLEELLGPGRDDAIHVEGEPEPAPIVGDNHGRPVFRLKQDQLGVGAFAGLFVGGVGGVTFALLTAGPHAVVAGLACAGVVVGAAIGKRFRHEICADPGCGAVIPGGAKTCSGCDGIVAGDVRHRNDRLDAADRWAERQAITARGAESRGPRSRDRGPSS